VLDQVDAGKPAVLVIFVGRVVERGLNMYLEDCTPVTSSPAHEDKWVLLSEAAEDTLASQETLDLLARTRRIEAV